MPKLRTHYDNLKIARNAPDAVIRAAYKALMQQYHPDKYQGSQQEALRISKLIKQSYEILINPVKRFEHDLWIDEHNTLEMNKNSNAEPETIKSWQQKEDQHNRHQNSYQTNKSQAVPKTTSYSGYNPNSTFSTTSKRLFNKSLSVICIIGMVVLVLIVKGVGGVVGKKLANATLTSESNNQNSQKSELFSPQDFIEAARIINSSTPKMVDATTRLDKAEAGPGSRLTYFYTFPKYKSTDLNNNWLQEEVRQAVIKSVCTNNDMLKTIQHGATYVYSYNGNDNFKIGSFGIDKTDCNSEKTARAVEQSPKPALTSESEAHLARIKAAYPNVEEIVNSPQFDNWITSQSKKLRLKYEKTRISGSSVEVIAMLNDFKQFQDNIYKLVRQKEQEKIIRKKEACQKAHPQCLSESQDWDTLVKCHAGPWSCDNIY